MDEETVKLLVNTAINEHVAKIFLGLNPLYIFIVLMIIAGLVGGTINRFIDNRRERIDPELKGTHQTWFEHCVIGTGATVLIPLFLSTISSGLIQETGHDHSKYLIFLGFCIIAAFSGEKFIHEYEY